MAQTKQGPIHRLKLRRPPLATSVNAQCSSVTHSACCPLAVEIAIIYTGLGLGNDDQDGSIDAFDSNGPTTVGLLGEEAKCFSDLARAPNEGQLQMQTKGKRWGAEIDRGSRIGVLALWPGPWEGRRTGGSCVPFLCLLLGTDAGESECNGRLKPRRRKRRIHNFDRSREA